MKKFLVIAVALLMALCLVACAAPAAPAAEAAPAEEAAPAGDKPTIAYVPKVIGQAWWDYVRTGVEAWGADNGYDIIYQGPTEVDAAAQVQIMTDIVAQLKANDILCFSPNDPAACENICKEAMDKGIIVIATEASGMTNVNYDVEAFDEAGLGGFMMDQLAAQMGEEGEYCTMVGSMTMESHNNWADAGVARQEEAYPNMTLVDDKRVSSESDAEIAYQKTKELLTKYPNLKGILGTSSFDAPGAARAIKELGLSGKVFAISVALPSEARDFLKEGVLTSVALWDPAIAAQAQLNLAMAIRDGQEIKDGMDLGLEGYNSVVFQDKVCVGQGWLAITADNVDTFTF